MDGGGIALLLAVFSSSGLYAGEIHSGTSSYVSQSETRTISGTVKDATGEPLIGVSVLEKGSISNGVITDTDGKFSITVAPDAVLVVSYLGFKTQEFQPGERAVVDIVMEPDNELLEEVVVVGFGTMKKESLTGSVAQVKMDEVLGSRPVVNALTALQGTMPGLQITPNNDASGPGQTKSFNIRGTTSINGGSPLVLIDNVPGDIDMLNPEDIESVSVLKDAAASAVYGARAAFGVILVTTKKGAKGEKFTVNYNNFGFQNSINRPEIADGMQWLQAYLDADYGSGTYYAGGQNIERWMQYLAEYRRNPGSFSTTGDGIYVSPEDGVEYYLNEKNVYDNILDNFGFLQSHNASVSGGTERLTYRMSVGYSSEQGILVTDKDRYNRLNGSSFIQADVTSWFTQSLDFRYGRSEKNMPVTSTATGLYDMRLPALYPEGELSTASGEYLPTNTPYNLLQLATDNNTVTDNLRITSKSIVKPLKGWDITFEYTFNKTLSHSRVNRAVYPYTNVQRGVNYTSSNSSLASTENNTDYHAFNLYTNYIHTWNNAHNLNLMAGFNQEFSNYRQLYAYSMDMINDSYPSHNTATNSTRTITEQHQEYTVRGAFFRFNYDYRNRYLFGISGRYDGSSKFPRKNRFGFFPSVSAAWNIAREGFMQRVYDSQKLTDLKIRASWGQIGNQAIDPYQYTAVMSAYAQNDIPWIVDGQKPTTIHSPGLISNGFTWETVQTLDFGFDLVALNSRLTATFDWYQRDTKDMLAAGLELPAVVGADAPLQNVADLRTKGWELSLGWRDQVGDFGYNVAFNLYDSRTIITDYNNESKIIRTVVDGVEQNAYYVGYEIGSIWGYVTDGYYTVDDFVDTQSWQLAEGVPTVDGVSPRPGDIKYKNLRDDENSINRIDAGDGTVDNPGDRTIIGNDALRFQYGLSLGFNYKGFDLSILLQGVGKRDVWISDARRWPFQSGQFGQLFSDQLDYWRPISEDPADPNYMVAANPNAEYYRLYDMGTNAGYNQRTQTKYLLNGAYLRVKNVTLSYTFPRDLIKKIALRDLKVFLSCENLATFSHLPKGYDPERLSWNYPFYRTISFGINVTL